VDEAVLLLLALAASAFFSGVESALFSLSRLRLALLAREPSHEAQAIVCTMRTPNAALITLLVGNNFANLGGTALATAVALRVFGDRGIAVAVPAMTVLILLFTEVLPKTIALNRPEAVARATIRPFRIASHLAWPFRVVLGRVTEGLIALVSRRFAAGSERPSEEATTALLKAAVDIGYDEGILAPFEKEIFDNIADVHDLEVREILTPRTEIFALPVGTTVAHARRLVKERRLSRVPVYDGRFENLVGLLHAADLLPDGAAAAAAGLRALLRPLYYVPESKPVVDLLSEFRRRGVHFAVAVEESGGIAGIVTLEDILEEIVGEIRDERHVAHQRFVRRSERSILVSARMELAMFRETFDVAIESPHAETIGGYLLERSGRIPKVGEMLFFDGLLFVVRRAEPHRLLEIEITKFPAVEGARA
jgi:putative hemolysin